MAYEYMRRDGVVTREVEEQSASVSCSNCYEATADYWGKGALHNARSLAHRHIKETGHEVEVQQTRLYIYGPQLAPKE